MGRLRQATASLVALVLLALLASSAMAQGGPRGPGGGFGGQGGPGSSERLAIVERFDLDGDGWLDTAERAEAKAYLSSMGGASQGPGRARGFSTSGSPGEAVSPEEVASHAGRSFFDPSVLRTIFIDFGFEDWEAEMAAFYNTDVELPVTATIDGVVYQEVGVRFRGNSSYSMVPAGLKRPIRIKLDTAISGQSVEGVRTIKLLNGINDPSMLRTVLVSTIMQDYIAAPRANFVHLVINGESWGIYQNQQHYNTDLLRDHFGESGGVRWEVPGSPNGRGGMVYLGEDPDSYREIYQIDNRDTAQSWAALTQLFRLLEQTPGEQLVETLEPILDIEGVLRFLALDVALVNSDGYWTRASDYEIYLAEDGRFHLIPHDLNEALGAAGGGPGGGANTNLDPLIGISDASKPLRSKLLAVPELRKRYLEIVLDIAERWLDWERLGPIAGELQALIDEEMQRDSRNLYTYQQFQTALDGGSGSLRSFVEQRRAYLLTTLPGLIEAIPVAAYQAPAAAQTAPAQTDDAAEALVTEVLSALPEVVGASAYGLHEGPDGWHLTAGSGRVLRLAEGDGPAAAFVFDALGEGFGDNKLDQCLPIDAGSALSIAYRVYADAADASGLGVRLNPNFHASLASCEAAMAMDAGGDRLSGGRSNEDIDLILGQADGGRWLLLSEAERPELRFEPADIPEGAAYLRLSLRARDRSGLQPAPTLLLAGVSVVQAGAELLVNGDFGSP